MKLTLPLTLLVNLLLPLAMGLPAHFVEKRADDTRTATQAEIDELTFYTSLSADSYCSQVIPGGRLTSCPNCDKAKGVEVVDTFTTLAYDTNVLLGRSDAEQTIYVVFRGSASISNWVADLTAVLVPYTPVPGSSVHTGFLSSYKDVQKKLVPAIKNELSSHSNYTVAVTGHSLGGATGLLCALDLYQEGIKNIALYTQGQPRVGDKAFVEYVTSTGIHYERAVHKMDSVPHVPPTLSGFYHGGEEFWDNGVSVSMSQWTRINRLLEEYRSGYAHDRSFELLWHDDRFMSLSHGIISQDISYFMSILDGFQNAYLSSIK